MRDYPSIDPVSKHKLYGRHIAPPRVDADRCTGCQSCIRECPSQLFELRDDKAVVVVGDACIACGHCWAVCPERAVTQPDSAADLEDFGPEPPLTADALEEFLMRRRSVRHYRKKPIPRETLERIAQAGQYAPTGSNRQNVHLVVVSTPDQVHELRRLTEEYMLGLFQKLGNPIVAKLVSMKLGAESLPYFRQFRDRLIWLLDHARPSPYYPLPFGTAVILAHAHPRDSSAGFNCITALHSCAQMAQSEGLGSCYVGFVAAGASDSKPMRQWLGLPKGHKCHGAMVLGYPKTTYLRPVKRWGPTIRWK